MSGPSLEEFGKRFIAMLPRLLRELHRHASPSHLEGKISSPQLIVLDHLHQAGPSPMSILARITNLHCSTATHLVDRLMREGLVERAHDTNDRRVVSVSITKKGRTALKQIYRQKQKAMMGAFENLSSQERKTYLEILEKAFPATPTSRTK